ncbi:MAG: hypothetical protein LBR40_00920 [Bacilli bacterium]|jgi:hypothetical protein|nr:hypothetical protein [Bacilli bacterium]
MKKNLVYYNEQHVPILIKDNRIKIGTKIIDINKLYDIHFDYVTNYNPIFTVATTVAPAIILGLIYILIFRELSMAAFVLGAIIGIIIAYIIHPRLLRNKAINEYNKIIDFIHLDTHESILVKSNELMELNEIKFPKKNWWQKRTLGRYINRIKKSRKYLARQMELKNELTPFHLYEKYHTVAEAQYQLKNNFSIKQIEVIKDIHQRIISKSAKLGYYLARLSILLVILIFIYMAINHQLTYKAFF